MGLLGYYLIAGIMFIVGLIVSGRLKTKFSEYSQIGLRNGLSGKEIAEAMLEDHGIYNVRVATLFYYILLFVNSNDNE
jgi:Zn-dependent membrane protease YugP